jgi:hypothetical protein
VEEESSIWRFCLPSTSSFVVFGLTQFMKVFLTSRFLCVSCHGLYIACGERLISPYRWARETLYVQNSQSIGSHVLELSFTPLQALIFILVLKRITSTQTLYQGLTCKCQPYCGLFRPYRRCCLIFVTKLFNGFVRSETLKAAIVILWIMPPYILDIIKDG